jgi:Mrp family chromosome partitioning ATPase
VTALRAVRRHWWLLTVCVLMGLAGAGFAIAMTEPVYTSSASVLVQPVGDTPVNLQTEAELARSTDTAAAAAGRLGEPSAAQPASVEVLPNTSVLVIHYEAATPAGARDGARAFAEAYLISRTAAARSAIDDQLAALAAKIQEYEGQLVTINARMASLPATSPESVTLRGNASALTTQLAGLTSRANDLATTTVNAGRIIQEPTLPTEPVRPDGWLYLLIAGGAGVGMGLACALARDRLSRHVRHGVDVTRRGGVPLLAELPEDPAGTRTDVLSPKEPGGRAFNRLRNEVVASLGSDDAVILVTGVSPGGASTVVAANLAAALARADNEVILVGANVSEIDAVTLSQVFDVADIPGLTDVLTGRVSLSRSLQRAARLPRLRIVTPGGTASAAGLLQSEGIRGALNALRHQARYLVVEAPSAASGADAQSLARAADVAILVVEAGRARHAQVADAAVQVRRVSTRLLGAVVVPRVVTATAEEEPFHPMHRVDEARELDAEVWLNDPRAASEAPTTALKLVVSPAQSTAPSEDSVQS